MPLRPSTLPALAAPALALVAVVLALAPARALAWTDATVRSARATVELEEGLRTRVSMTIELRVDGGWLEAFELDGLEPGLVLDPEHPPTFGRRAVPATEGEATSPDALASVVVEPLAPRVTSHERGRVSFAFSRRSAPRRGDYRIELTYVAPLASVPTAHEAGSLLGWTFPAWRFGLDGVEIDLLLPAGSLVDPAFRAAADGDAGIVIETGEDEDGRTRIHLVRHHLPRTRAWPLAFIVPASAAPAPVLEHATPPAAPSPTSAAAPSETAPPGTLLGALVLMLLVLGKNATLAREDREAGFARPVEGFLRTLAAATLAGVTALVALLCPSLLPLALAGLALCAVHRPARAPEVPTEGVFRAASAGWVRAARAALGRATRGLPAWLRIDTLRGAALGAGLCTFALFTSVRAPAVLPLHHATVLVGAVLVVLASGGRSLRERSPLVALGALLELARGARLPGQEHAPVALAPMVYADRAGRVRAARIRVVCPAAPPGLVRLDLVLGERDEPALVAVARSGTAAAERLATLAPLASAPRERVGFVLPTGPDVGAAIATLALALTSAPRRAAERPAEPEAPARDAVTPPAPAAAAA